MPFIHSQPLSEIFSTVNLPCCNNTFTNVHFVLPSANSMLNKQIILDANIGIISAILSEIFVQIG